MSSDSTPDVGELHAALRGRVRAAVEPLADTAASTPVPATPDWSVHDIVAHLSGSCCDILEGRLEGVASDAWTAAQVEPRRNRKLSEVLDEWDERAPGVEAIAQSFGPPGRQWLFDAVTHEHDLCHAIGATRDRTGVEVVMSMRFVVASMLAGIDPSLGPLEIRSDAYRRASAEAAPVAVLEASPFELMRASSGRRSVDELMAYDWTGDPEPYLPMFSWGPFTVRSTPLAE